MLNEVKIRSLYEQVRTQLYRMIPEKWDKVYLYASFLEQVNGLKTGEMYFYYCPTGILKKNYINVYEIPAKFNIDEDEYMVIVNQLYQTLKQLREEFKQEELWSNLTIYIEGTYFRVHYVYEDLLRFSIFEL